MADIAYDTAHVLVGRKAVSWAAIWAGVFAFIAIWSVFGVLGTAIFASSANPNAAEPVMGMTVGMGIWAIVLTIIAMYVAGRITGRLAAITTRTEGAIHGLIMFGLSVVSALVIAVMGGTSLSGGAAVGTAHSPYVLTVFADLGWIGFIALFLGWLAAMGGAASGSSAEIRGLPARDTSNVEPMRPAA